MEKCVPQTLGQHEAPNLKTLPSSVILLLLVVSVYSLVNRAVIVPIIETLATTRRSPKKVQFLLIVYFL